MRLNGSFIKLPAGFDGKIHSAGSPFRAVVISGQLQYHMQDNSGPKSLEPGSYFGSKEEAVHHVSSGPDAESVIYVRTVGTYRVL